MWERGQEKGRERRRARRRGVRPLIAPAPASHFLIASSQAPRAPSWPLRRPGECGVAKVTPARAIGSSGARQWAHGRHRARADTDGEVETRSKRAFILLVAPRPTLLASTQASARRPAVRTGADANPAWHPRQVAGIGVEEGGAARRWESGEARERVLSPRFCSLARSRDQFAAPGSVWAQCSPWRRRRGP